MKPGTPTVVVPLTSSGRVPAAPGDLVLVLKRAGIALVTPLVRPIDTMGRIRPAGFNRKAKED